MTCCKWFGQLWRQNYQPLRRPGSFFYTGVLQALSLYPVRKLCLLFYDWIKMILHKKKSGVTVHVSLVSTCSSWSVETFLGFMSRHSDDLSFLSMIGFIWTVFYSILLCDLFLLVFLSELSHQQTCRFSCFLFFVSFVVYSSARLLWLYSTQNQVVCFCFFSIIRPQFFHTL